MKDKIQNIFDKNRPQLIIDPSIELDAELKNLVNIFRVKIISFSDNEEILTNLYFTMKVYFSDALIEDIIESCLEKSIEPILIQGLRNKKINELLK